MNKLTGWDNTIVAIATPPGVGAIAVIRLSGKESFRIINELFPSKDIYGLPSHTIHIGLLKDNSIDLDEVVLSVFRGPKSYTGEDVIEISCHGSPFVQQQIIEACIRHGARLAKPGEFTQRAFLQGKLDLTQSEAVADLIAAGTGAAQKTALQGIRGGFAQKLKEMREELIQFAALVELELDFATEDVEFADRAKFRSLVEKISENTGKLAESFKLGNVIKNGVSVAIIGKPNSGKSTLLNTLLNENRAIVSEIAGTTRDTIEEVVNINGILFRLIDTAGIRAHSSDVIENIGMEKSREKMRTADLVLYLFDSREETKESLQQQVELLNAIPVKYLLVANKSDLGSNNKIDLRGIPVHSISALQEKGMEELKKGIYASTVDTTVAAGDTIITNARHYEALLQLSESLSAIRSGLDRNLPGDLLAPDIRQALYYLGEITGEVTNEDKLDYIFSKFCIGK